VQCDLAVLAAQLADRSFCRQFTAGRPAAQAPVTVFNIFKSSCAMSHRCGCLHADLELAKQRTMGLANTPVFEHDAQGTQGTSVFVLYK
jgi:hypothetical protein